MARKQLVAVVIFALGLVVTFYVARGVAWRIQDFDSTQALSNPDCDDCVTTATLDALPYVAVGMLAYVLVAALLWRLTFRTRSDSGNASTELSHTER